MGRRAVGGMYRDWGGQHTRRPCQNQPAASQHMLTLYEAYCIPHHHRPYACPIYMSLLDINSAGPIASDSYIYQQRAGMHAKRVAY